MGRCGKKTCKCSERDVTWGTWLANLVPDANGSGYAYCKTCGRLTNIVIEKLKEINL